MKTLLESGIEAEDVSLLAVLSREGTRATGTYRARPTPFGRYTLQRSIGGGGFGEVFLATDDATWKPVAIKVLRADRRTDKKSVERFEQEIQIGRQLRHPNILPIIDDGRITDLRYFACPYVEGQNLLHALGKSPLPVSEAVSILRVVSRAVATAHRAGYLHRDLKPANILIESASGTPYVADFGLAKSLNGAGMGTETQAVLGTQPYMPPEQADPNLGDISPATDVYALGVTLYQCLTGRTPFPRPDRPGRDITLQIARDRALPPSRLNAQVSPDLDRLCLICLEKSPFDRYSSADRLADDLDLLARGEPIRGTLPSRARRVYRALQRHPRLSVALALLLIIAVGGSVTALHYADRADRSGRQLVKAQEDASVAQLGESQARRQRDEADAAKAAAVASERAQAYVSDMREVPLLWDKRQFTRIQAILDKYDAPANRSLRIVEWHYWRNAIGGYPRMLNTEVSVAGLALSPDGALMAFIGNGRVFVMAVKGGNELLRASALPVEVPLGDEADLADQVVAFDPSGRYVAACCRLNAGGSYLRVWDLEHAAEVWTVRANVDARKLAFSSDGRAICATIESDRWASWATSDGSTQGELPMYTIVGTPPIAPYFAAPTLVRELAESTNRVVGWCLTETSSHEVIRVWDLDAQRQSTGVPKELLPPRVECTRLAVAASTVVAFGGRTIALWDLPPPVTHEAVSREAAYWQIASSSGRVVATPDFDNSVLSVTSTADASSIARIPLHTATVLSCSFSDDDQYVLLRINNVAPALPVPKTDEQRPPRLELWRLNGPRLIYTMPLSSPPHGNGAFDLALGMAYLVGGENRLACVNLSTGDVQNIDIPFRAVTIAASPIGSRVAIGGDQSGVYDLEQQRWLWTNSAPCTWIAYHRAEKYVLVQPWWHQPGIRAFDARSGDAWPTLFSGDDGDRLVMSPDNSRAYSMMGDRLRLYSLDENPGTLLLETSGIAIPENDKVDGLFVRDLERQLGR